MKRWTIILLVLALVAGGWYGTRWLRDRARRAQEKPVQTAASEARDIVEAVDLVGEIASALDIEIKSEVSGKITQVTVANGETVKQKQLLLALDKAELESQHD